MDQNKVEWTAVIVMVLIGVAYFLFMALEYMESQKERETVEEMIGNRLDAFFARYEVRNRGKVVDAEVIPDES